jgi:orotate phosphoribosyltransferase
MAIGADPITASIITLAGQQDLPLKGFMVRKEPKDHGTGKQVEGPVKAGSTSCHRRGCHHQWWQRFESGRRSS